MLNYNNREYATIVRYEMNLNSTPSMKISHNIIEHLGLKLYQNKPTNVIAELISNAWDANSKHLNIYLKDAQKCNRYIAIEDDGCGMDLDTLANTYLVIGKAKYNSLKEQQELTNKMAQRKPMGRKGIGKLSPFGICNEIHLITVKNGYCNWLHFNYQEMIKVGKSSSVEQYHPTFIFYNKNVHEIENEDFESKEFGEIAFSFFDLIKKKENPSGTLIVLTNLTLKKAISSEQLLHSIGQRFTIAIGRPDFNIKVNNVLVTEDNALPQWELRIPTKGMTTVRVNVNGIEKEIKYWIGFIKEATWPTEHAGIGVYAHGKIAQDRPFFFNIKGQEIFSRYMYGVIEADLIEELEEDLISTDRTTINWDNVAFEDFFNKGKEIAKDALKQYADYRKSLEKEKNLERIKNITNKDEFRLSNKEQAYLGELLNEVTHKLGKDEQKIQEITKVLAKSWLNEPSRRIVKELWNNVEKEDDLQQLQLILSKLSDELVPQSLSLTRTFAQRVFALTKLKERIEDGKETPLQLLLEDFPWILSHSYEKFTKRQSLSTVISKAKKQGALSNRDIGLNKDKERTIPDFVFLGSANDEDILVVELKANTSVGHTEFEQLRSYVEYLEITFSSSNVKGILIASSVDKLTSRKIKEMSSLDFMSWDTLLKKSRKEYITFLTALLLTSEETPEEAIDWGGKEIEEFLIEMAKNDSEIQQMMKKYKPSSKSTINI